MEAVVMQGLKLADPIHDAAADWSPGVFLIGLANYIFAVAVADAIFREQCVAVGIGRAAESRGVAGIPVEHEIFVGDGIQHGGGFLAGGGVAGHFVFEQQDQIFLGATLRGLLELGVDGGAVGSGIVEAPEIEAADALGFESLGEGDAALEKFVLCVGIEVCVELIAAFALAGDRRAGPIGFEEWAGDVGDAQFVLRREFCGRRRVAWRLAR